MLHRLRIENYRCFRLVDVPLRPLTVLIGANDSGKSSFLNAIELLLGTRGLDKLDVWRYEHLNIALSATTSAGVVDWAMPHGYVGKADGLNLLRPANSYRLPSSGVPMISQGYSDQGDPPNIEPDGTGIPALVDHLLRRDRRAFDSFVESVKDLVPGLDDLEVSTPDAARRSIDLIIEGGLRIPAERTSTGVRLVLFFVGLAYHPSPPRLILLEEPENGVHPTRLGDVVGLLRSVAQGRHGRNPAQVILTTHSPYVLDHILLDQDQALVFRRNDADGSRTAEPADADRLKTFLDEFMLGEVWFNQGEEGLVARSSA